MSAHSSPDDVRKSVRFLASIAIVVVLLAGATVAVRAAYGAFSDDMTVRTTFARAGQALQPGSDVKYRGVNVGKVRSVELQDRKVEVAFRLKKAAKVPRDTAASVRTKTVFGEKFIDLAPRPDDEGPYLRDGDRVEAAGTGLEVEDLVDSTDTLLRGVDADELATLVDELVAASQGEGERVARLIDQSVTATQTIASTLDAQLRAIDSFQRFARQYRDIGPSLNGINANLNELLPTFNAARKDYERLLTTLRPFADDLAEFVEVNEADIGQILSEGDNVVRVLTARKQNISETIRGLDHYTATLADAIAPGTLPDGSRYGNMKLFIDLSDLRGLLCSVLGPSSPGADLSAVREALAARVPMLSCPGDAGATTTGPGTAPPAATPPAEAPADGSGQQGDPATDIAKRLATPDTSTNEGTVGDLLAPLVGSPS